MYKEIMLVLSAGKGTFQEKMGKLDFDGLSTIGYPLPFPD